MMNEWYLVLIEYSGFLTFRTVTSYRSNILTLCDLEKLGKRDDMCEKQR